MLLYQIDRVDWPQVCTTSPARIDLAGGWTDTPPVSYEYGGVVVNAAILVDGKRALEARVRRTAEPGFNLKYDGQDKGVEVLTMDDIMDYSHPLASAALLKTAMLCVGLVDMNDEEHSLQEQLEKTLGGGGAKVQSPRAQCMGALTDNEPRHTD